MLIYNQLFLVYKVKLLNLYENILKQICLVKRYESCTLKKETDFLHYIYGYNCSVIIKNNNSAIQGDLNMILQYHCACCDEAVSSTQKVCPKCGSQHIKSPYGLWTFCLAACLIAAVTFKVGHIYLQNHNTETPAQVSLLSVLQPDSKSGGQ